MKQTPAILVAAIVSMLPGCSTAPTVLRVAVGPNPFVAANAGPNGYLQVFSATEEENDIGFEFSYNERTDYSIYNSSGKKIKHVRDNNLGHFDDTARAIGLPAGTYKIKALMARGLGQWIVLPVVIEPGRTTKVHLNRHWKPPATTPDNEFVRAPWGVCVGWRAAPRVGS